MSWQNFPGNILLRSVIWFFTKVLEYEVTFCMKWKNAQNCNWLKINLKWQDWLNSCHLFLLLVLLMLAHVDPVLVLVLLTMVVELSIMV